MTFRFVAIVCAAPLLAFAAACGGGSDATPSPTPSPEPTPSPTVRPTPSPNPQGVRFCGYAVGNEVAKMPINVAEPPSRTPSVSFTLPAQSTVDPATTQNQLAIFNELRNVVNDTYVYPDFNGSDWNAIADNYEAMVRNGLTGDDFYVTMAHAVSDLGDDHSYFQTPEEVAADSQQDFVGIGVYVLPIAGTTTGSVIAIFPGSPAEGIGLRPHDLLLKVDGLPIYNPDTDQSRTIGEPGTTFELTFHHAGEAEQTVNVTRRAVSGGVPVDYCLVPDTGIGYISIPTFLDQSVDDQITAALTKMTAKGPLDGLVLDERLNRGGSSSVLEPTLALFTGGTVGRFVSRTEERPLNISGVEVANSQTVPIVILVDGDTESFGEIFAGILQSNGRATIVGGNTSGNVEALHSTTFADGSRMWLAEETFAPPGLDPGLWEGTGITPDVRIPTRWDLFTEASDPALARAVDVLVQTR